MTILPGPGHRNLLLILAFLAFVLAVLWIVRPPGGYSPELLYAIAYLVGVTGGVVVAGIVGRAANKVAERWKPPGAPAELLETSSTAPPGVTGAPDGTGKKP